ncbi:MAG TPA: DUF3619 family protein [Oxalicibacterium sp.]
MLRRKRQDALLARHACPGPCAQSQRNLSMNAKDLTLAYKVRHALDQGADNLPESTAKRLSSARKIALSRKKQESEQLAFVPRMANAGPGHVRHTFHFGNLTIWAGRMGVLIPLVFMVFGLLGLYRYEQREQLIETANIDAEVLTDDLPLSAYLDHGFNAFLANGTDDEN